MKEELRKAFEKTDKYKTVRGSVSYREKYIEYLESLPGKILKAIDVVYEKQKGEFLAIMKDELESKEKILAWVGTTGIFKDKLISEIKREIGVV